MPSQTAHQRRLKYCSHSCYTSSLLGKKNDWGHKISKSLKGKPKSPEHIQAVIEANKKLCFINRRKGSQHPNWKGDKCSYSSIHDWVKRIYASPDQCQKCGIDNKKIERKDGVKINYLHLANISGEYKRDVSDWTYLCPPCHSKLDRGRNSIATAFILKGRNTA